MRKNRKVLAIIVAGVMVALVAAGMIWWLKRNAATTTQNAPRPAVTTTQSPRAEAPPFTVENATFLESALNSGTKDGQAKALTPQMRNGDWKPEDVLPEGATLRISDPKSFTVDDQGYGKIDATVTGSAQATFTFNLGYDHGRWLIIETSQK